MTDDDLENRMKHARKLSGVERSAFYTVEINPETKKSIYYCRLCEERTIVTSSDAYEHQRDKHGYKG